jgi:TetR/AcrR family transcriptional repressor of nem operon
VIFFALNWNNRSVFYLTFVKEVILLTKVFFMARTKLFSEEAILDKAMKLFWEKGYNATSAQDLVDGLGISRSSLYDTYGDKHSLFVTALKRYRKERIDPVLEGIDTATDLEQY